MGSISQLGYQYRLGACLRPFGVFVGQPKAARTTASHHQFEFVYFRTIFCFSNISAPEYCTETILYSKFKDGSQFSGEKGKFVNPFHGLQVMKRPIQIHEF